jgi:hypothetical protein
MIEKIGFCTGRTDTPRGKGDRAGYVEKLSRHLDTPGKRGYSDPVKVWQFAVIVFGIALIPIARWRRFGLALFVLGVALLGS